MRRFRFRLERLLEIRSFREREAQIKLAEKSGLCIRLSNRIKETLQEAKRSFQESAAGTALLDLSLLLARDLYLQRLKVQRARLEEELEAGIKAREEARRKFLEVSREKKVLEKLKERRQNDFYTAQKKEAFKLLDEINLGREVRNKVSGV